MSTATGYIPAGGKSSRMGADKAFLKIGGRSFLENAAGILKPACGQIKIVINKSQTDFIDRLPSDVSYIFDRFKNRGALGGVHAALADCQTDFAVVLAVDLPYVTGNIIENLVKIIAAEAKISAIVPRQPDGRLQPLCAVYRVKECLPKASEILSHTESASMRDFLEKLNYKEISAEFFDQKLFANINTPTDYKNLRN